MVISIVLIVVLFLGSCSLSDDEPVRAPEDQSLREAAWVYADVFNSPERREAFLNGVEEGGFNTVYLSVYQPTTNSLGHRMFDHEAVAEVIRRAHEAGVEIWAAYGNDDWVELGARPGSFPADRFGEIEAFDRMHPGSRFDGIILNVEPGEPVDMASLLAFYDDAVESILAFDMKVAAAVRFFWKEPVADPSTGSVRAAHEAIIDLPFDHVVVMGYRNFAGDPCTDNGLICLNEQHVLYAHRSDRKSHILVGLRTSSTDVDAGHAVETFDGLPRTYLNAEKRRVVEFFRRYSGFGGFATHRLDVGKDIVPDGVNSPGGVVGR